MEIRTRFAPSPTGYMHIGNLRTALFSYLIAKSNNGKFILRIEDTDKKREITESINTIYSTLKQSNLLWDEGPDKGNYGPYIQSDRVKQGIYLKYAKQLIEQGDAYYCFCPEAKTDLDTFKEDCNYTVGLGYNGHCRNLSEKEIKENLNQNKPYVIRQKMPKNKIITYYDEIYGNITFNSNDLDDQVLIKQDGYPTYNFANVIDDHLMNITHIVRGNEYLSSTPKYILLYQSFNWDIPKFIHLPLINGKDENGNISKLSKRHGAVSFEELIKNGYLPDAIINYIAFLGWNPKNNEEIFNLNNLINIFSIDNLNKSSAIFDYNKLDWYNSYYIKQMNMTDFINYGKLFLNEKAQLFNWSLTALHIQSKISKFSELNYQLSFLYNFNEYDINLFLHEKYKITFNKAYFYLNEILDLLEINYNSAIDFENILRQYANTNNIKFGTIMWCFRIAISGRKNTIIGGIETAIIIGLTEVKKRIKFAINILKLKCDD